MNGKHPIAPEMAAPGLIRRPLRGLIAGLALLPVQPSGEPDYIKADSEVLVGLAESAELALQIIHDGLASIGLLHAYAAHQIAEGDLQATHATALGRLQVELAEVLSYVYRLGMTCRRYTSDYVAREDGRP